MSRAKSEKANMAADRLENPEAYGDIAAVRQLMALAPRIMKKVQQNNADPGAYLDMLCVMEEIRNISGTYYKQFHAWNHLIQRAAKSGIKRVGLKEESTVSDLLDVFSKSLLMEAPYDFDQYMQYMEFDRRPEQRFYLPRKRRLKPVVEALQAIEDGKLDELFLSMPPRVGKALANDTPILTTNGWKKHGDLVVGDELYCPDGSTTKVIAVHPKCEMTHTVTFTDGTSIDCHFRHEWLVEVRGYPKGKNLRLLETQEMIGKVDNSHIVEKGKRKHRYRYMIPLKSCIQGKEQELPVKPYTLGAWLGDGSNNAPRITGDSKDSAIPAAIEKDGYALKNTYINKFTGALSEDFEGLRNDLQKIGLCHSRKRNGKYIPDIYFTASIEQRLDLLAGLLDTDGCLIKSEKRYNFVTSEETLRDSVITLISTFGWRVGIVEHSPIVSSSGIKGKHKYWAISFNPTMYIPCRLERKQLHEYSKPRRVAIQSIEPLTETKEGNCITVEKDGMYLAGERLMPTHNTTILVFFLTWMAGKYPDASNLYSSCSDTVTTSFYNGLLEIMRDPYTYHWQEVFPEAPIVKLNADKQTVNVLQDSRFPTITCRSIDGTLNGACDCDNILIGDDLCKGIEQAINKDVMGRLWQKVSNDLLSRAKQTAKKIWIGTRWSLIDPIGCRLDVLENEKAFKNLRYKVVNLPALDSKGRSNFDYKYRRGFTTADYERIRATFEKSDDMPSWMAQYMGQPVERSGSLFTPQDMRFYNGDFPAGLPARVFMAIDPAWGGGDFCAGPVCVQYGRDIFVPAVVFTDADKTESIKQIVDLIKRYEVSMIRIEATKMTSGYADELKRELRNANIVCSVETKPANPNSSKEERIKDRAPEIKEFFLFLDGRIRPKAYQKFMENVYGFSLKAKNKHDDAPDSLSMAADMVFRRGSVYGQVFRRF